MKFDFIAKLLTGPLFQDVVKKGVNKLVAYASENEVVKEIMVGKLKFDLICTVVLAGGTVIACYGPSVIKGVKNIASRVYGKFKSLFGDDDVKKCELADGTDVQASASAT